MGKLLFGTSFLLVSTFTLAQESEHNNRLTLHYRTNVYELSEAQEDSVCRFVQQRAAADSLETVQIVGYTDERGAIDYNQALSERRAGAIAAFVRKLENELPPFRIAPRGATVNTAYVEDVEQRRADIVLITSPYSSKTRENQPMGGIDLSDPKWFRDLLFCSSAREMLAQRMYALDQDGHILKTGGMVSFRLTDAARRNPDFGQDEVSVRISLDGWGAFDPEMLLWAGVRNSDGEIRWVRIPGRIEYEASTNSYRCFFRCADLPGNWTLDYTWCLNIDRCMDCPAEASRPDIKEKVIYVSTFKDYGFTDVGVTHGRFSAVVEREGRKAYAFVVPESSLADAEFYGVFNRKGKNLRLRAWLGECAVSGKKQAPYFEQGPKTHYFINQKEYNKKGFFAWVARWFEKGDRY